MEQHLWTDESKIALFFGSRGPTTVKHGGVSFMIWDVSHTMVFYLFITPGIMDRSEYIKTVEEVMLSYAEKEMFLNGCFNKTTTPNTPVSSSILVPDQPVQSLDWLVWIQQKTGGVT